MTDREKALEEALRTVVGASNGSDVDAIGEALYAAEQLLAQPAAEALCRCYGDNFPLRDGCVPHASTPAPHPDTLPRFSVREMGAFLTPRVFEVAERMVASGPALAQVSNSEIHEVVDALLDVRRSLGLSRREGT